MSLGWKSQYEIEAVCEAVHILKVLQYLHPQDARLADATKTSRLKACMLVIQDRKEIESRQSNIILDRLRDCQECERTEGYKPCRNGSAHLPCKYKSDAYVIQFIEKHLGRDVLDLICKYGSQSEGSDNQP